MTVHVDRPGVKISPTLYGIFFEEINRAGEGGLYGEMLQNRSFEDDRGDRDQKPTKIPGWSLVLSPGAKAVISLDNSEPLNPHNPTFLRLEIANAGQFQAGVANEGFKGLALVEGASYLLSFYARCGESMRGPVVATLEDQGGVLSEAKLVRKIGQQWKQYRSTLTAKKTTASGRLVLALSSPGTLWLDMVSLFPEEDLEGPAERPAARPGRDARRPEAGVRSLPRRLLRGRQRLANAFRWKNTIGDLAQRPGHWNLWGYRSTDGLGYHEYLQMCEDLGPSPLFVINCGMAHEDSIRQTTSCGPWIQDALDAIEYANGPADSTWGSLRAKAGHPAPFNLQVHGDRQRERRPGLPGALPAVLRRHQGQVPGDEPRGQHARRARGPIESSTSTTTTPRVLHRQRRPATTRTTARRARRSTSANTPSRRAAARATCGRPWARRPS